MVHEMPPIPHDWEQLLIHETKKPYFEKLKSQLQSEIGSGQVFPPAEQIFEAFHLCKFNNVRVVILGQDPYHNAGQAHGLCFSVNDGVKPPPSLKNIFKELQSDINGFTIPQSGNLSPWARQGVLLLNAILTVNEGHPGSHRSFGWENFTDAVIAMISAHKESVVFMLWGNFAQAKRHLIDESRHLILAAPHPSPLARGGFAGCRHFSQANIWLASKGLPPINWNLS